MFKLFDSETIFIKILITICIFLTVFNIYLSYENDRLITSLDRKIDVFKFCINKEIIDILDFTTLIAHTMQDSDKNILNIILDIFDSTEKLKDKQSKIEDKFLEMKKIDVENEKDIIQANLLIVNKKQGICGSGTHIKINNKSYVLTCAHLMKKENDNLIAITDMEKEYILSFVKINIEMDLALFEIKEINDLPYLEISEENPKTGSEVLVIGNPDGFIDVISDGIIAKITDKNYYVTNITFFGGSGGALLYKGKIIGVIKYLYTDISFGDKKDKYPVFVNYTCVSKINILREFLEGVE